MPVVVDDRDATERIADPTRGGLIERLTSEEQIFEIRQLVLLHEFRVLLFEDANGGGRRRHRFDVIFGANFPPNCGVGPQRNAFVHDGGAACEQRRVDDVAVPHDPANVRRAKHRFTGLEAEDFVHAGGERDGITPGVALHAFGLARGAAGVQDVAWMRRLDPLAGHLLHHVRQAETGPVNVTAWRGFHGLKAAIKQQHFCWLMNRQFNRCIEQRFVRHDLAHAHARVGGDDHFRLRIINARSERGGGETTKHYRVNCADAHRGEHRENRFRDHRHVDQYTIALGHAERLQHGRDSVDLGVHLLVRVLRFDVSL